MGIRSLSLAILAATIEIVTADTCPLCADGVIPNYSSETCNSLKKAAEVLTNGTDKCLEIQSYGFRYCGCLPPPLPENPSCTLCPEGAHPSHVHKDASNGFTCGNLALYLMFVKDEEICSQNQRMHAQSCGCKTNCTGGLCTDGSEPYRNSSLTAVGDLKCEDVEPLFENTVIPSSECSQYQYLGTRSCGCPEPEGISPICDLCQDGEIPPNWNFDVSTRKNCLQIAGEAAFDYSAQGHCHAYQVGFGPYCGCNNDNTADACRICGGNELLPEPNRIADLDTSKSCAQVEMEANKDGASCSASQEQYENTCCSTGGSYKAADEDCRVCRDGSYPSKEFVVNTRFGDFSCRQMATFPSIIPDAYCRYFQDLLEQRCGCGEQWITLAPTTPAPTTPAPATPAPGATVPPNGTVACGRTGDPCSKTSDCCIRFDCNNEKCRNLYYAEASSKTSRTPRPSRTRMYSNTDTGNFAWDNKWGNKLRG